MNCSEDGNEIKNFIAYNVSGIAEGGALNH